MLQVVQRCSEKKGVLRNFVKLTIKYLCEGLFYNKVACLRPATLFKKETLTQVFSCQFCEISKTPFFIEHLLRLLRNASINNNSFKYICVGVCLIPWVSCHRESRGSGTTVPS